VILFIFEFGIPPFRMAQNSDVYYRFFTRNYEQAKFFFKIHPATKDRYRNGDLDPDLIILLISMLSENPSERP
jgi:hypothetical protein